MRTCVIILENGSLMLTYCQIGTRKKKYMTMWWKLGQLEIICHFVEKNVLFGIKSQTSILGIQFFFLKEEESSHIPTFFINEPTRPAELIEYTNKYLENPWNPLSAQYDAHIYHIVCLLDQASK